MYTGIENLSKWMADGESQIFLLMEWESQICKGGETRMIHVVMG